jgi:ribosomal protein S25
MKKSKTDQVLTHLAPKTYYRPTDVAKEMNIPSSVAGSALKELSGGGN